MCERLRWETARGSPPCTPNTLRPPRVRVCDHRGSPPASRVGEGRGGCRDPAGRPGRAESVPSQCPALQLAPGQESRAAAAKRCERLPTGLWLRGRPAATRRAFLRLRPWEGVWKTLARKATASGPGDRPGLKGEGGARRERLPAAPRVGGPHANPPALSGAPDSTSDGATSLLGYNARSPLAPVLSPCPARPAALPRPPQPFSPALSVGKVCGWAVRPSPLKPFALRFSSPAGPDPQGACGSELRGE